MHLSHALRLVFVAALVACGGGVSSGPDQSGTSTPAPTATSHGGGNGSGGSTAATPPGSAPSSTPSGTDCHYDPVNNPQGCPASYSYMTGGQPCPEARLQCWYPGQGDGESNGCFASALLACQANADGGALHWVAAQ